MTGKELTINSIGDLQIALIEDNNDAIKSYIERLDRETSNLAMTQAAGHFGFPVVEIEGVVRTSAGHLAKVFGYKQPRSLSDLLLRRGICGIKVGGFEHNTQIEIKQALSLDPDDHKSILYDWPAFLVGGMNSQNEEAQVVQAYLLRAEKIARVGIVAVKQGALTQHFPDAAHGLIMVKLAKQAWQGNPLASYILEKHYDVPVKQLLHRTDPELSELAGQIAQYLHFICDERITQFGIRFVHTEKGSKFVGNPQAIYQTLLYVARRHHLPQFFSSQFSLGSILGREADALDMLGWKRSVRKIEGYNEYTYEYIPPMPDEGSSSLN
ncbi:MAG: hypothetical protein M0Z71_04710 [Nitrospiraceae bacterium]|nr:hypothetical protein [Nitrospiraceae bacterium]